MALGVLLFCLYLVMISGPERSDRKILRELLEDEIDWDEAVEKIPLIREKNHLVRKAFRRLERNPSISSQTTAATADPSTPSTDMYTIESDVPSDAEGGLPPAAVPPTSDQCSEELQRFFREVWIACQHGDDSDFEETIRPLVSLAVEEGLLSVVDLLFALPSPQPSSATVALSGGFSQMMAALFKLTSLKGSGPSLASVDFALTASSLGKKSVKSWLAAGSRKLKRHSSRTCFKYYFDQWGPKQSMPELPLSLG